MATSGVRTINLPAAAIADSVLVHNDGSTAQMPFDPFKAQVTFGSIASYPDLATLIAAPDLLIGKRARTKTDEFEIVSSGTYSANGATVIDLTGISGQAVNTTRAFPDLESLLADTRPPEYFAADPSSSVDAHFVVNGGLILDMQLSGATDAHAVTAGGVKLKISETPPGYIVPDAGPTNALLATAAENDTRPDSIVAPAVVNASFLDRHRGPVVLRARDYTAAQVLDMGSNQDKFRLSGQGPYGTRLLLPDGQYLYDSVYNPLGVEFSDMQVVGGKGLICLRNDDSYGRGIYSFRRLVIQGFTECAIGNLSSDFGRWTLEDIFFWAAGNTAADITGIAVALGGDYDNSVLARLKIHKARAGIKLYGSKPATIVDCSFMRGVNGVDIGQTDIWIVPQEITSPFVSGGLKILGNRFGNENLYPDHFRVLIADEDAGSGDNFVNRSQATTASAGRLAGVILRDNDVTGSSNRPFVYSRCGLVHGFELANRLRAAMPGEIAFDAAVTPSTAYYVGKANVIDTRGHEWNRTVPQIDLSAFAHMFEVRDPAGTYAGMVGFAQDRAGASDPNMVKYIGPATAWNPVGTTSATATADNIGGSRAVSVQFAGDDSTFGGTNRLYYNSGFTVAADGVGQLCWVEIDLAQGLANSLLNVGISIKNGTTGTLELQRVAAVPQDGKFHRLRYEWVPKSAASYTLAIHSYGWVSGTREQVRVGRPAVYQADSPANFGHSNLPEATYNAGHLVMNGWHLWPDATGRLRINSGMGASDTGSTIIAGTFTGSGSPEGVITAPVGALYARTNGGASTTLYVKESGTGNTGWVAK